MIKIDASSVIPKRLGAYALGIVPGILFCLSACAGDPARAQSILSRVASIYPLHGYALFGVFLMVSLFIGQTFYCLGWYIDWTINVLYWIGRALLIKMLASDWLYTTAARLQAKPPRIIWRVPSSVFQRLVRISVWARQQQLAFNIRPVLSCQQRVAEQILQRKYRLTPSVEAHESNIQEWSVWRDILGQAPPFVRERFLLMRTFLGCGVALLVARHVAPALQNHYFDGMADVIMSAGLFQSISITRTRREPVRVRVLQLHCLLEELGKIESGPATSKDRNVVAIDTDDRS